MNGIEGFTLLESKKSRQRDRRLAHINNRLKDFNQMLMDVDNHDNETDRRTYYVIDQVELMSYQIFDLYEQKHVTFADEVMNNVASAYFQLVVLTLLSLHSKRGVDLDKVYDVIENNYPVAHLDSRFQFHNNILSLQRLNLMFLLQNTVSSPELVQQLHAYVLKKMYFYALK